MSIWKSQLGWAGLLAMPLLMMGDAAASAAAGEGQVTIVRTGPAGHAQQVVVHGGGYLGVTLEDITDENRGRLGLVKAEGVLVQDVDRDTPAAEAGILSGDVILSYAGQSVLSAAQFSRLVAETPAGRTVEIVALRGGQRVNLQAKIGERSARGTVRRFDWEHLPNLRNIPELELLDRFGDERGRIHWGRRPMLGVTIIELTDQLRDKYALSGKGGVFVTSVLASSAAAKAGIKAGDVITDVAGRAIRDAGDIGDALRDAGDKEFEIRLQRDGQALTLKGRVESSESSSKSKTRVIL